MILIVTHKLDFTADFVVNKLNERGINYFRFNCEDIQQTAYHLSEKDNFELNLNGNTVFKSVWFRRTKLPEVEGENLSEKLYLANEYDALLSNFYDSIQSKKWLSHPNFIYRAENKVYQLKLAKKLGFNVPRTIITNDFIELEKFIQSCNSNIIIKPLSMGRIESPVDVKLIYTNKVRKEHIENIQKFTLTPAIFQEYIEKEFEVRVTVIANKVISAVVKSQENEDTKVDWRRKKLKFIPFKLPDRIERKCVKLLEELNISFGAIDLIKTTTNQYFFLEINPNGQWAWLEIESDLKISDEIIKFLTL